MTNGENRWMTRCPGCDAELPDMDALRARVAELEETNAGLLQANRDSNAWFDALNADHQKALKALDKLARLGNEPYYGNSIGNEIALRCLDSLID